MGYPVTASQRAMKRWLVFMMFAILMFHSGSQAQTEFADIGNLAEPAFYLDFARFRATDPAQTYLEVYYMISYDNLQFIKTEAGYAATFDAAAIIYDDKGRQVDVNEWRDVLTVATFDETNDDALYRKDQTSFILDPGSYKLVFRLTDSESKKVSTQERELKASSFDTGKLAVSDIEFASHVSPDTTGSGFMKSGRQVIPNIARRYGDVNLDLYLYYEVYNLQTGADQTRGTFNVLYEIRDRRGNLGLSYETTIDKPGQSSAQSLKLDLGKLKEGVQRLQIKVRDNDSRKQVEVQGEFIIQWSDRYLIENDFDLAVEQLRYIAGEDQIRTLKNAPEAERAEAWEDFWKSKDPTPGTPQNELKKEYYRRIQYTNGKFSTFGKNGWKSDMGAIYIIYGPPNEVDRHPYEFTSKPYEIWYYYEINRKFLFVDENGFGDYRLYYPDWYQDGLHHSR